MFIFKLVIKIIRSKMLYPEKPPNLILNLKNKIKKLILII
jgi:hypothetical protein